MQPFISTYICIALFFPFKSYALHQQQRQILKKFSDQFRSYTNTDIKMIGFNYKILAIFINIIVIISTFKSCSNSSKLLENCVKSREKRLVSGINFERVTSIIFGPEFISNDMTFRSWLISDRIFGYIIGGKKGISHFYKYLNIIFT